MTSTTSQINRKLEQRSPEVSSHLIYPMISQSLDTVEHFKQH